MLILLVIDNILEIMIVNVFGYILILVLVLNLIEMINYKWGIKVMFFRVKFVIF